MPVSQAFRVSRLSVVAGTLTAIKPPIGAREVSIGNATTGDLQVHTSDDETEYLVIAAGYERLIPVKRDLMPTSNAGQIAFWVKAAQSGTVVILWY